MNENPPLQTLCVFCGSSEGNDPRYPQAAIRLANAMIQRHISLVYGGGGKGLMGLISSSLYGKVPKVTGIIPERLYTMVKDTQHHEDELIVVPGMHERKAAMYRLSDAFVALPGGVGTIEEIMETFTWLHLGYQHKPVALLNANGYFDYLLHFLEHTVKEYLCQTPIYHLARPSLQAFT